MRKPDAESVLRTVRSSGFTSDPGERETALDLVLSIAVTRAAK